MSEIEPITNVDSDVSRASRPLRMVTLLIVDNRSGQDDLQLAEVRVPLRSIDPPDDGYWAYAKDICDELQATPSRIDGEYLGRSYS
jgi:hypothetical protein